MARTRPKTAAELVAELANTPSYVQAQREQEVRAAAIASEVARDEGELVAALRASGESVESVWDYVSRGPFTGPIDPSPAAVALLVAHLDVVHHPGVREGIIRALSRSDVADVAREPLLRHFHNAPNDEERWLLANALAAMVPYPTVADVPEMGKFVGLFTR